MANDSWGERARRIEQRLQELAGISDESGMLTRTFLSPAMREANARVKEWMREAGLQTEEDYAGIWSVGSVRTPGARRRLSDQTPIAN